MECVQYPFAPFRLVLYLIDGTLWHKYYSHYSVFRHGSWHSVSVFYLWLPLKGTPQWRTEKITEPIPATNLRRETRIIFAPQSDAVVIPTEHFVDRVEH